MIDGSLTPDDDQDALDKVTAISDDVYRELMAALERWPAWNSAHEGYAVLLEEVDELWEHVKSKQSKRDLRAMRAEAIQVAAMAIRFALQVCDEDRGRR